MKRLSDSSANQFDARRINVETGAARVEISESLPSTNDLAITLAKQASSDELPLIVLTQNQTQGRGQRDDCWFAGKGSLTFSLAVNQQKVAVSTELIPAAVALAVCEAIEATTGLADVQIKWPNDIVLENQKVGGILIESVVTAVEPLSPRLVIGIGINVNNSLDHTLQNSLLPPISLLELIAKPVSLTDLLIATTQTVLAQLSYPESFIDSYNVRSIVNGKNVSIMLPDSTIVEGLAEGITSCGGLLISPNRPFGELDESITVVSGRITKIDSSHDVC